jgi:hypothetical protein
MVKGDGADNLLAPFVAARRRNCASTTAAMRLGKPSPHFSGAVRRRPNRFCTEALTPSIGAG